MEGGSGPPPKKNWPLGGSPLPVRFGSGQVSFNHVVSSTFFLQSPYV